MCIISQVDKKISQKKINLDFFEVFLKFIGTNGTFISLYKCRAFFEAQSIYIGSVSYGFTRTEIRDALQEVTNSQLCYFSLLLLVLLHLL